MQYRRRDDGLADIFAMGLTGPDAQAVLQRIRAASAPFGSEDERSAGKRRLDAFVDLLLGRERLPLDDTAAHCGQSCGCRLRSPVPCGADVSLLVPVGGALGTTDEVAQLAGHGPVEPDRLEAVLLSAPRIRTVWIDDDEVPVATSAGTVRPARGDAAGLRALLLRLAAEPPPASHPRHPWDHEPAADPPVPSRAPARPPRAVHPPGTPGPYRPPASLRRLVQVRAALCEWPGCGVRAVACDIDHDLPWPYGPTCSCNVGPLCRRHHRVKQCVMTKVRGPQGVVWTDPTGRWWTASAEHSAPARRGLAPLPVDDAPCAGPIELAELRGAPDDDPVQYELRTPDVDPDEPDDDRLAARIEADAGWGLALDDPYRWTA